MTTMLGLLVMTTSVKALVARTSMTSPVLDINILAELKRRARVKELLLRDGG